MSVVAAPRWKGQVQGRTRWRLFFASVLCGPLAGLLVMIVLGLITVALSAGRGGSTFPPFLLVSGAVTGAVVGWPAMLLFGLPAHSLLYRRKSHRIGGYLLAGVLGGFAVSLVLVLLLAGVSGAGRMTGADLAGGGIISLILVLASVAAAAIFWFIRRPDKDVMQPDKLAAMFE